MTPTPRDNVPAKSPVSEPVASHSPFDPHLRPMVPGEVYHLPPHLDPAMAFQRVLDPGTAAAAPLERPSRSPSHSLVTHLNGATLSCSVHVHPGGILSNSQLFLCSVDRTVDIPWRHGANLDFIGYTVRFIK